MKHIYRFAATAAVSFSLSAMDRWNVIDLQKAFENSLNQQDRQKQVYAYHRFAWRVKIDRPYLSKTQCAAIGAIETKIGPLTFEEFTEPITRTLVELKKAIEADQIESDFKWSLVYEPEATIMYPDPEKLKQERLKTIAIVLP